MTIRYPSEPSSGLPYVPPEPIEVPPGGRLTEAQKRLQRAALAREVAYGQRLSGTNVVSRTRSFLQEPAVPAPTGGATGRDIDWQQAEHHDLPVPVEIEVQRIPTDADIQSQRLSAEIDALRRQAPGRW